MGCVYDRFECLYCVQKWVFIDINHAENDTDKYEMN